MNIGDRKGYACESANDRNHRSCCVGYIPADHFFSEPTDFFTVLANFLLVRRI